LISTQVVLDEDSLATSLTITNSGQQMIAPQCLLHTYLAVEDARQVMIFGLEESVYEDKLTGGDDLVPEDMPAVAFRGETDRIYRGVSRKTCPIAVRPEGVRVDAHGVLLARTDGTVVMEIPPDVVIWNPHVNKARAMGDFDDDGWTAMACVEPGIVASDRTDIAPGASLVLSQTIAPED
jgi:glucose-6-phosphate 1-epimerase